MEKFGKICSYSEEEFGKMIGPAKHFVMIIIY